MVHSYLCPESTRSKKPWRTENWKLKCHRSSACAWRCGECAPPSTAWRWSSTWRSSATAATTSAGSTTPRTDPASCPSGSRPTRRPGRGCPPSSRGRPSRPGSMPGTRSSTTSSWVGPTTSRVRHTACTALTQRVAACQTLPGDRQAGRPTRNVLNYYIEYIAGK